MKRVNLKVLAENKYLQVQIDDPKTDKEELMALRSEVDDLKTDKAEMLALHTANEKLQAQLDRINDLLAGVELVVAR